MEILTLLWVGGILFYFARTSPRGRENHLLVAWILMALPIVYWLIRLALV